MNKNLYIFGNGDMAEVVQYYFNTHSDFKIEAFVVDDEYFKDKFFCEKKVLTTSDFLKLNKDNIFIFVALGYRELNKVREKKYQFFKEKGYKFASYISSKATVLNNENIGENCLVLENNVIQPFVTIGHNVIIWSGNHIGHHSIIEDNVYISSQVVISGRVKVCKNSFIGVNSTFRDNIKVGSFSIFGAGSLISKDTDDFSIYKSDSSIKSKIPSNKIKNP